MKDKSSSDKSVFNTFNWPSTVWNDKTQSNQWNENKNDQWNDNQSNQWNDGKSNKLDDRKSSQWNDNQENQWNDNESNQWNEKKWKGSVTTVAPPVTSSTPFPIQVNE